MLSCLTLPVLLGSDTEPMNAGCIGAQLLCPKPYLAEEKNITVMKWDKAVHITSGPVSVYLFDRYTVYDRYNTTLVLCDLSWF